MTVDIMILFAFALNQPLLPLYKQLKVYFFFICMCAIKKLIIFSLFIEFVLPFFLKKILKQNYQGVRKRNETKSKAKKKLFHRRGQDSNPRHTTERKMGDRLYRRAIKLLWQTRIY